MSEFDIKINTKQLEHLFNNIRKLNGAKKLLSKKLRITPQTLDDYLKQGNSYLEQFEDKIEEIYDIDLDLLDENFENNKLDYVSSFLNNEGMSNNGMLTDKNKNAFEVYFFNTKCKAVESAVYRFQKDILDNIKFSDDKKEDYKIRTLIQFVLIYERGQMSIDEELLYLKNKYSKTSSKHVAIVCKDLERRNKEDFGDNDKSKDEQKSITTINNNQINNFTHYSIEYEKAVKGFLEVKEDEDIIDVEKEDD